MKNTKNSARKETRREAPVASVPPANNIPKVDPFDTTLLGNGIPNYVIDPSCMQNAKFPPIDDPDTLDLLKTADKVHENFVSPKGRYWKDPLTQEAIAAANKLHDEVIDPGSVINIFHNGTGVTAGFDREAAWIQTHSGRRFNPTNPNPDAIVIQDIAHALSMQCRFSGHCRKFYSVAQHSVLVSYICDSEDALWGLLHDASEAYLVDVPRPLKRSGKFDAYIEFEHQMQEAICRRFGLPLQEPPSVKKADTILLATEARDLMSPLHSDWVQPVDPLPFIIDPWGPDKAKDMFMKRFFDLIGADKGHYEHYLRYRDQL